MEGNEVIFSAKESTETDESLLERAIPEPVIMRRTPNPDDILLTKDDLGGLASLGRILTARENYSSLEVAMLKRERLRKS